MVKKKLSDHFNLPLVLDVTFEEVELVSERVRGEPVHEAHQSVREVMHRQPRYNLDE